MKTMNIFMLLGATLALTACNDDENEIIEKDWAGTTYLFNSTDEKGFSTYYTPAIGTVGDPMPFFDPKTQTFKVLYLQEYASNDPFCYHPIWGVETKDCANYESLGEVLSTGKSSLEQDAALGTGCCVYSEADGLYYIYYTGHNPQCKEGEVIMRATSSDFKTWTKDLAWAIRGSEHNYSTSDFRDPQIFKDDNGLYHMVIASCGNLKLADYTSSNLKDWTWAGDFSNMLWDRVFECPDIFKMGDWWYLTYFEQNNVGWCRKMKYFKGKTLEDLRNAITAPNWPDRFEGVIEGRGLYAAKTASDGTNRYCWGWCPTRTGGSIQEKNVNVGENQESNWSGSMVCHRLIQNADGVLTLGPVEGIKAKYNQEVKLDVKQSQGANVSGSNISLSGDAFVYFGRLGYHNHISMKVKTSNVWDNFGFSFVRGYDNGEFSNKYYTLRVNAENEWNRKVNFEEEGSAGRGFVPGIDGGRTFETPSDGVYNIDIFTDNSVCVIYINDMYAYTNRIYGIQKNGWSINNYGGNIEISDLSVTTY